MSTPSLAEYVSGYETMFAHYDALCRRLTADQLATRSLCPEWDVRGVIAHVMGVEQMLDGWSPSAESPPPFAEVAAFAREVAGLSPDELADRVAAVTASRLDHLRSLEASVVDAPSFTPTGIATYGAFLQIRLFDLWVHARDIAVPMGDELDDTGFVAETALTEVAGAAGYIVGKKIGLPDGKSVVFHVSGGVERDVAVRVDGRAAVVDAVDDPDVEVLADVGTFVLLAAGRLDPQEQIDSGRIAWRGDQTWGDRAARNLAYTM
ncbi:MAG: maleylpyruvate isomerase family mycothiol-dependent enzyme [Mycobacteriales bacterium]